jgi:hypothetical protein
MLHPDVRGERIAPEHGVGVVGGGTDERDATRRGERQHAVVAQQHDRLLGDFTGEGTVGGRIAGTRKPSSRRAIAIDTAASGLPRGNGWIALAEGMSAIPAAAQVDARANPAAMYALIAGVVAIVFNVLLVPSILAIVFASSGIKRSRELAAAGHANTMRALSVTGLVLGIFGAVSAVIPVVVFIVTLVAGTTAAYSG